MFPFMSLTVTTEDDTAYIEPGSHKFPDKDVPIYFSISLIGYVVKNDGRLQLDFFEGSKTPDQQYIVEADVGQNGFVEKVYVVWQW